jgi:hypothetical protein
VHNKFELALEISKEEDAAWFVNMINYLYLVERKRPNLGPGLIWLR